MSRASQRAHRHMYDVCVPRAKAIPLKNRSTKCAASSVHSCFLEARRRDKDAVPFLDEGRALWWYQLQLMAWRGVVRGILLAGRLLTMFVGLAVRGQPVQGHPLVIGAAPVAQPKPAALRGASLRWQKALPWRGKDCPDFNFPIGATLISSSTRAVGGKIVFSCDSPRIMVGHAVVECKTNGQWSEFPQCPRTIMPCTGIRCELRQTGRVSVFSSASKTQEGGRREGEQHHHCEFHHGSTDPKDCMCWCWGNE